MTSNGEHTANQFIVHYLGVIKQDLRVNHNEESVRIYIDPSSHTPLAQKDEDVTTNPRIVEVISVSVSQQQCRTRLIYASAQVATPH